MKDIKVIICGKEYMLLDLPDGWFAMIVDFIDRGMWIVEPEGAGSKATLLNRIEIEKIIRARRDTR